MIQRGMAPKKAVQALHESLVARGRDALMPRIGKAFARIAARDSERNGVTLSVAREKDASKSLRAAKKALSEMDVPVKEVTVVLDESLIGGWRLEGRERLHDASFKKSLLEMYNRSVA
jgi:F0F1-type ATP synthase delta subunit